MSVGPSGEALLDYALFDAARAGFQDAVLVVSPRAQPDFRRHLAPIVGPGFPVRFAHQADRPARGVAGTSAKPWGTGHALLCAAPLLTGSFAVCNADDFYGADAFRLVQRYLAGQPPAAPDHAVASFRLDRTLSPHGGVSRAIVERGPGGHLARVTEVLDIQRGPGGITGRDLAGKEIRLSGEEPVSMNLWGFTPAVLPRLQHRFTEFERTHAGDPDAEFLISAAMNAEVAAGRARIRVLEAPGPWLGMTFRRDTDRVRQEIASLAAARAYPSPLRIGQAEP